MANNIKFKDVAHFYLGCEIQIKKTKEKTLFNYYYFDCNEAIGTYSLVKSDYKYSEVKPILRHFHSITKSELKVLFSIIKSDTKERDINIDLFLFENIHKMEFSNKEFIYLLKKGFDLFGLIESGQAIDAIKIK